MQQLCDFSYRWHFFSAISSGRKSKSEKLMCTHTLLPRNRENGAKGKLRKWLLCHVGVCLLACVRLSAVREECCLSMYHVSHRVSVGVWVSGVWPVQCCIVHKLWNFGFLSSFVLVLVSDFSLNRSVCSLSLSRKGCIPKRCTKSERDKQTPPPLMHTHTSANAVSW